MNRSGSILGELLSCRPGSTERKHSEKSASVSPPRNGSGPQPPLRSSCRGMRLGVCSVTFLALSSTSLLAQLAEGPGRDETERLCEGCHEIERSVSRRQDRDAWQATLNKMVALGTKATDEELALILDYLAKNYPADEVPPVNVNTAPAIELESRLALRRSQAAAIIAYRSKNGRFKTIDDLKKVPGVDTEKIEAKKDRIVF
ncbi:MAG: hypothetical protein FJW26_16380 [Acidimicrobiia bacterium]|nr:hypothetical protein [Acidimicrobiia bacterium]